MAADVTRILDPAAPAKNRQTSIAVISRASAVPSVNNVNVEKEKRKTGRLPKSSDSGAYARGI